MVSKTLAKKLAKFVVLALLILGAGFGVFVLANSYRSKNIAIGDQVITPKDINAYASELTAYKKEHPLAELDGTPTQIATDDLVLNAALKFEAGKQNKKLTKNDLIAPVTSLYKDKVSQQNYLNSITYGSTMKRVRAENVAYENLLARSLIANKTLLIASSSFDTPYFRQANASDVQSYYDQAHSRMVSSILPLFRKKATKEEIATKVDVNTFDNDRSDDLNYQQYFKKSVVTLSLLKNYAEGQTAINDLDSTEYIRGNVGKLEDTDLELAKLKNVGDYTNVFTSKTGAFMIARLEQKSGGPYSSWTDMLNIYKEKYAANKKHFKISFGTQAMHALNTVVYSLASVGQQQAEAWIPPCSDHTVQFIGRSYDVASNTYIGGTKFHESRTSTDGDNYLCAGTVNGTAYATTGGTNNTINDNCMASEPSWGVDQLSPGYTPIAGGPYNGNGSHATWSNSVGGQSVAIRNGATRTVSSSPNSDQTLQNGWPEWTPERINANSTVYIYFLYQGQSNHQPIGQFSLTCSSYSIWDAYDPDESSEAVIYRIVHTNGGYYGTNFTTDQQSSVNRTASGSSHFAANRTYQLQIMDDDGSWVMTAAFFLPSCGNPNPTPGGPTNGTVNCNYFNRTLQDHSIYRFTTFPKLDRYLAAWPNPTTTSGNKGSWASLTSGRDYHLSSDYQSGEINSTSDSSDSNYVFRTSDNQYTLRLQPPSGSDRYVFTENWHHDTSNDTWTYSWDLDLAQNCYSASCSVSIDAALPGTTQGVKANQGYTVHTSITNTGTAPLPSSIAGTALDLTGGGSSYVSSGNPFVNANNGADIQPGETYRIDDTSATAPSDIDNYTLQLYPDYYGRFALGSTCSAGLSVYQHFNVQPHVHITSDEENPRPTTYTTGGTKTEGPDVSTTDHSWLTQQLGGLGASPTVNGIHDTGRTFGSPPDESFTYSPASVSPGDKYCANVKIDDGSGWLGPGGAKADVTSASANDCITVHNEPYMHVINGDVSAGGGFGNNCQVNQAGISTFTKTLGSQPVGSGVQLGALSIGPIEGLNSANLRNQNPSGSVGLTFSNAGVTVDTTSNAHNPVLGGRFGGSMCSPDYFAKKPPALTAETTNHLTLNSGVDVAKYVEPSGGTLTIDDGLFVGSFLSHVTVYVKGNVVIKSNFIYSLGEWSIDDVPNISIIAKGGNIYVDHNVQTLDGLYVAQPDNSGNGGGIYTCAEDTVEVPTDQRLSDCHSQLVVNGSLVASHTYFDRSFSSLRYGTPNEHYNLATGNLFGLGNGIPPKDCGNGDRSFYSDCAAEIIMFAPEIYAGSPNMVPDSGPGTDQYDYITDLSPVI